LTYIDEKRLELGRALASRPRLLLLDEWLAGLNPAELALGINLVQTICQSGVTIILVEHVMHAVRALCDRVVIMDAGSKVAEGKPDAVLANPEVVRAYLGDDDA
jgi:branched-chain amino acid transport system ATP-binding protein